VKYGDGTVVPAVRRYGVQFRRATALDENDLLTETGRWEVITLPRTAGTPVFTARGATRYPPRMNSYPHPKGIPGI